MPGRHINHQQVTLFMILRGVVTLTQSYVRRAGTRRISGSRCYGIPLCESLEPVEVSAESCAFVAGLDEQISQCRDNRNEALKRAGGSEMLHHAFALSQRDMAVLGPVIESLVSEMLDRWHGLLSGCTIGSQLVGDHPLGSHALLLQQSGQDPLCRLGVAPSLHDLVENIAILIDRAPKPVCLAGDADHHLVQVPDIVWSRRLAA